MDDFLVNKTNIEIEKYILESIQNGYLKNVSSIFIRNYGIEKLKEFWQKHIVLKREAFSLLSEYFKWTYNFKEKSFEEIFLRDFNVESCGLCYNQINIKQIE